MFSIPFVLRVQFGNRWRYICCLLVQWLILVCWFVGSLVVGCCYLAQVYEFGTLCLRSGMFVLSHWFGAFYFLLFDSTLPGWGPAPVVGAIFCFWIIIVFRALYGVRPLRPRVDMQLCYLSCLVRSISVLL